MSTGPLSSTAQSTAAQAVWTAEQYLPVRGNSAFRTWEAVVT